MRKRSYAFDEEKTVRYIRDGRGAGLRHTYRPWLEITDVPSLGRSHRPYSFKTERVHHLLSDGEWKTFLRYEADPLVIDIQEQFPLDREETHRIALALGVRPPITIDGTPYVLTIDFLVTYRVEPRVRAYSFKYEGDKLERRSSELHEIARRFLQGKSIPFQLVDSTPFNEDFERAFDSIRVCYDLKTRPWFDEQVVLALTTDLVTRIRRRDGATVLECCRSLAAQTGHEAEIVFTVLKHLLVRHVISTDLYAARDLTEIPLCDFRIPPRGRA